jgi:hypothetical protein
VEDSLPTSASGANYLPTDKIVYSPRWAIEKRGKEGAGNPWDLDGFLALSGVAGSMRRAGSSPARQAGPTLSWPVSGETGSESRGASPFSTQQGIKEAEFERVLVVLDDDEGTHVQFSYDKYFGIGPLSGRDEANLREGKETALERRRRLFYVCCTRALKDLVVVLFTSDVAAANRQILQLGQFPAEAIHLDEELARF